MDQEKPFNKDDLPPLEHASFMYGLLRETVFGRIVRHLTKNKVFSYPEERIDNYWKHYIDIAKTHNMAHHGTHEDEEKAKKDGDEGSSDEHLEKAGSNEDQTETRRRGVKKEQSREVAKVQTFTGAKVDAERGKDIYLVDWAENDPEMPLNWSRGKKNFAIFQICLLTFGVYIGSSIYSPGVQQVSKEFGVSEVVAVLGLSLFVAGYGTGPLILSPLSEIPQIGRSTVYIGSLALFVLLQIPTALSVNIGMLLAFRFLTGFIGSPPLATGGASIQDIEGPHTRPYAIAIWGLAAVQGPVMGPLIGGFVAQNLGWRDTIWILMAISGTALLVLFFFLPETSSANILYRRTKRLRKITGDKRLKCLPEMEGEDMTFADIAKMTILRPITLSFTEPIILALNTYIALVYGLLYLWFESFVLVFVGIYGFSIQIEGLTFIGILIGAFAAFVPFYFFQKYYVEPRFNENDELAPEVRLPIAIPGGFCIVICMFWFGWSSRASVPWIVPVIGSSFFSVGAFFLFNAVLTYLGDAYPKYAASVLAGNDLMRSGFGAGFPVFANAMFHKLGIAWGCSLLGFLAIAFLPIPFLLVKYGKKLRMKSKRARHDL